jgi:hypothetical protein
MSAIKESLGEFNEFISAVEESARVADNKNAGNFASVL